MTAHFVSVGGQIPNGCLVPWHDAGRGNRGIIVPRFIAVVKLGMNDKGRARVARLAKGSGIVFTFAGERSGSDPTGSMRSLTEEKAAKQGEPWLTRFAKDGLREELHIFSPAPPILTYGHDAHIIEP